MRFLNKRGEDDFKEWGGVWLRAPLCRVAGQGRNKWLRRENDEEWEARIGRDNFGPKFTGENSGDEGRG